ncbi:pecanex-like protein [Caerostris extrusa]|uniref:Pecanex-like protein n=1 Tax=Caerostris extrusa TaxID=172846 RepID=A0AAV4XZR8_CAEEX|nr:pecanex-like protein [Caerostris extrusa]
MSPFGLYMCCGPNLIIWTIYCIIVGIVFTALKFVNVQMHKMFDIGDYCEESSDESGKSDDIEGDVVILPDKVQKNSRNSYAEGPNKRDISSSHVDSMELLNRLVMSQFETKPCGSTIDLEVDVHHRESSGSSGAASVKQAIAETSQQDKENSDGLASSLVAAFLQQVAASEGRSWNSDAAKNNIQDLSDMTSLMSALSSSNTCQDQIGHSQDTAQSASSVYILGDSHHHNNHLPSALSLSSSSSSEALLKGTGSVELGFMSQDPSIRAAEIARSRNRNQARAERDKRVVRRAHSELETCPEKPSPSVPPEAIKPIVELSDEVCCNESIRGGSLTSPGFEQSSSQEEEDKSSSNCSLGKFLSVIKEKTAVNFLIQPVHEDKQNSKADNSTVKCGSGASSVSGETLSISLPDSNDSHYTLVYKPSYQRENCYDRTQLPFLPWGDTKNCPSPSPSDGSSISARSSFCSKDDDEGAITLSSDSQLCTRNNFDGHSDSTVCLPQMRLLL